MAQMNRGVVAIQGWVAYTDTGGARLFTLPRQATPLCAVVQVETPFDDGTSNELSLGIEGDDDYFASGVDVSAAGAQLVGLDRAPDTEGNTQVTGTFSGGGGDATAGRALVTLLYATPFEVH